MPELLDRGEVCRYFGGTRPINPATLYRGIRQGRYPRPVKVGPGSSRGYGLNAKLPSGAWWSGGDERRPHSLMQLSPLIKSVGCYRCRSWRWNGN
jgi:hypothetical protein